MAIIEGWLPPTREHWELISYTFQFFPLITPAQWLISWYGMGKTSVTSSLNLPGRIAWLTMEVPGFLILFYLMLTLPEMNGIQSLPWENKIMAGLFVIHYIYRAILFPILAPSMSPIHLLVWLMAIGFQVFNGISIGGWLGAYGPTTRAEWAGHRTDYLSAARIELGLMLWAVGFLFTIFHDDELREIRRAAARKQKREEAEEQQQQAAEDSSGKGNDNGKGKGKKKKAAGVDKIYVIPKNGFFKWILYPHYLFEWFEWTGYWIMGGPNFTPGRTFLLNEISTMLPRALQGKRWYVERFGKEKMAGKAAVIPGIL